MKDELGRMKDEAHDWRDDLVAGFVLGTLLCLSVFGHAWVSAGM